MLDINGTDIFLTRGDNAEITFGATTEEGEPFELEVGDKVKFTVKANANDETPLISIENTQGADNDAWKVEILPEHTKGLEMKKRYHYDVQLTLRGSWVETIIEDSVFQVGVEIG